MTLAIFAVLVWLLLGWPSGQTTEEFHDILRVLIIGSQRGRGGERWKSSALLPTNTERRIRLVYYLEILIKPEISSRTAFEALSFEPRNVFRRKGGRLG